MRDRQPLTYYSERLRNRMTNRISLAMACLAIVGATFVPSAFAVIVASDDAAQSPYDNGNAGGWQNGDDGGNGFGGWTLNNGSGFGSGGGFTAANNSESQINVGGQNEAWGLFGNGGGVGQAIRPFDVPLTVGGTFSIAMDNGLVDSGGTVGFGLQNSSGTNLAEFYFVGGQANYTLSAQNVSGTTPGFTNQGLLLVFTLTGLNAISLEIDVLPTAGVDHVVTANLNNDANQAISRVRLFNANAGFGGDHDAFYNMMSVTAVPELSAFVFGGVVCCAVGLSYGVKVYRRKRLEDKPLPA